MKVTLQHLDTCCPDFFQGYSGEVLAVGYFPCEDPTFIADSIKDQLEYVYQDIESLELSDKDINDMATWLFSLWEALVVEDFETEDYLSEVYSYLAVVPDEEEED